MGSSLIPMELMPQNLNIIIFLLQLMLKTMEKERTRGEGDTLPSIVQCLEECRRM
jgi:hypothetical protein